MAQAHDGIMNVASLYVGDLRTDVTEQTLWNVFGPFGHVLSVKVCKDASTGASLGYGYVNFRSNQEAASAMKSVNYSNIDGKPCRVMWSNRDSQKRKSGEGNLFLKNIDKSVDTKALYEAFAVFGQILSCKLATDDFGISKGYGFIQFYNEKNAEEALEKANGVEFLNRKIVVNRFVPRAQRGDPHVDKSSRFTNVFVKNFKQEWTDIDLKLNFGKFGEITSCIIQKNDNQSLGFGFVNFAVHESAVESIKSMNNFKLPSGVVLYVDRAQKKSERVAMLRAQHEKRRLDSFKRYQNLNLYVKCFDESWSDEKLKQEFSPYGVIQSAHVMKDEDGKSKGFGFVCFTTPDEAQKAIAEMNQKVYDNRPLYVAMAQNRDERKKMMEQRVYNTATFRPQFAHPMPIMYHQPGAAPYMPPFGRFPPFSGVIPRQPARGMQSGGQMFSHVRQSHPYAQGQGYAQQGYRQRASGQHSYMGQPKVNVQGGQAQNQVRQQHHYSAMAGAYPPPYMGSPYAGAQRGMYQPQQNAVNYVVAEQDPRQQGTHVKKSDDKAHQAVASEKITEGDAQKLGDRIYALCQKCFESVNDASYFQKLTAIALDSMTKGGSRIVSDEEIRSTLMAVHNSFPGSVGVVVS